MLICFYVEIKWVGTKWSNRQESHHSWIIVLNMGHRLNSLLQYSRFSMRRHQNFSHILHAHQDNRHDLERRIILNSEWLTHYVLLTQEFMDSNFFIFFCINLLAWLAEFLWKHYMKTYFKTFWLFDLITVKLLQLILNKIILL
jgi:hypothetical protein